MLSGTGTVLFLGAGLVIGLVALVLAVVRLDGHREREIYARAARRFRIINLIQGGTIAAAVVAGNLTDHRAWIPGLIAIIVGVHFLPLARPFERPEYRWIAAGLVATGLVGCVLALAGLHVAAVLPVVGLTCTVILWGSVGCLVLRAR
jgi:hypothetical protein